jgi:hypothetical protein
MRVHRMQAIREQIDRENRLKQKPQEDNWEPTYDPDDHKRVVSMKPQIKTMYHIIHHQLTPELKIN